MAVLGIGSVPLGTVLIHRCAIPGLADELAAVATAGAFIVGVFALWTWRAQQRATSRSHAAERLARSLIEAYAALERARVSVDIAVDAFDAARGSAFTEEHSRPTLLSKVNDLRIGLSRYSQVVQSALGHLAEAETVSALYLPEASNHVAKANVLWARVFKAVDDMEKSLDESGLSEKGRVAHGELRNSLPPDLAAARHAATDAMSEVARYAK